MRSKKKKRAIKRLLFLSVASWMIALISIMGVSAYFFSGFGGERETVIIPQLVGKSFDSINELDKINLELEPVFSSDVPEGEIISQFPYGGAKRKVEAGEKYTVRLTVSLGRESQKIPALEGFSYIDAAAILRSIGAEIRIVSVYDDEGAPDVVLRTSPSAGEKIANGETVTVFVSRNHVHGSICVGDFVGMPREVAIAEILAEGLTLGEITEEYSENYPEGCIIRQSISEGSYVLYGTKIDITVNARERESILHPFRKDIIQKDGEINESVD